MSYETLLKVYRKYGVEEYKKQCLIRTQSPATYRLPLSISINGEKKELFFVSTFDMMQIRNHITSLNAELEKVLFQLPRVAIEQYKFNCLIREILKTNEIEGVRSTKAEIKDAIIGQEERKKRFEGLAKKYVILEADDGNQIPLRVSQDIRNLYDEIVLDEIEKDEHPDGEVFRKSSVDVYSPTQKVLHRGVFPEENIINKMDDALEFLNHGECDDLIKIAIFHYYFGYIHPFYDGNGRVSRFISSYLLSKTLNPLVSFNLSLIIKENIKQYYQGFKDCNEKMNIGDITPFCIMFLSLIDKSLCEVVDELKEKAEILNQCHSVLAMQDDIEILEKKILYILMQVEIFDGDEIDFKELFKVMNNGREESISESTLRKYINSVEKKGYLEKTKVGRKDVYSINFESFAKREFDS